jgi:hypothetical protein
MCPTRQENPAEPDPNLIGNEAGRVLSWIFHPILLVAGGLVMAGQVFAVRYNRLCLQEVR